MHDAAPQYPVPPAYPSPTGAPPATPKTNILALVGFIISFFVPVAGLVLGLLATRQLSATGNTETGRGLARAATVIGMLGTLFQVGFVILWLAAVTSFLTHAPFAP